VPLPPGRDPADLALAEGGGALAKLVDASMPFVRFRVERELAAGDLASAEGKDRVVEALKPAFATLPPSALREELVREVADRMDLQPSLVASWLPAPGVPAAAGRRPPARPGEDAPRPAQRAGAVSAAERSERSFLAQCIALPREGGEALGQLAPDSFSSPVVQRAAAHLRAHLTAPGEGLPDDDPELRSLVAELLLTAREQTGSVAALEAERLKLELAYLERAIATGDGDRVRLLERREELRMARDRAIERVLEQSAPRD
jgi:DNA primase